MNRFDELLDFRMAKENEIDKIMEFIRVYWTKPNHILALDREFFNYEYCPFGYPNIYLAIDKKTGEIEAMHCLYFYEKEYIKGKSDLVTGMLLANPTCKIPFIGIELHKRVIEDLTPRSYMAPGVDLKTSAPLIKRYLHHRVERMRQFYILNTKCEQHIAKIANFTEKDSYIGDATQYGLEKYDNVEAMYASFDEETFRNRMPYKDRWYVERRYFNHPIYKYLLYGINNKAVLVCREMTVRESKALRIVDILGDPSYIRYAGRALRNLIESNNWEYVDLYEQAMNDEDLIAAGFSERTQDDVNIIPNYFEPFVQKNVEIWVNRRDDSSLCFKADGDQDRPNHR